MTDASRVSAVVLAAGASSRFGAPKLAAPLAGRPILEHVLRVARGVGFAEIVVVLGAERDIVERAVAWRGERQIENPHPEDGLSSSVRIGLEAVAERSEAALILLGDQPLVRADVVGELLAALSPDGPPAVVPRYAAGGGPNPVLLRRDAFSLAAKATGDRGLGPVLAAHPELVAEVPVEGSNPDVDTPGELATLDEGRATP